jgi:hypothetical protein
VTISEVKREFLKILDEALRPEGFQRFSDRFNGNWYQRDIGGDQPVQQTLSLFLLPSAEGLRVAIPALHLRYQKVEDLVAEFDEPRGWTIPKDCAEEVKALRTSTLTAVSEIAGLSAAPTLSVRESQLLILDKLAAPEVAKKLSAWALAWSKPIFNRLSDPDTALGVLSRDDTESRTHSGPDIARAKRSVALAFLIRGREEAKALAMKKLRVLSEDDRVLFERWASKLFNENLGDASWTRKLIRWGARGSSSTKP